MAGGLTPWCVPVEGVQSDASMSGQTHVRFTVELMPEVRRTGRMLDEPDTIHSHETPCHMVTSQSKMSQCQVCGHTNASDMQM